MRDLLEKTKIYAAVTVEPALKQCSNSDIPNTTLGLLPWDFALEKTLVSYFRECSCQLKSSSHTGRT